MTELTVIPDKTYLFDAIVTGRNFENCTIIYHGVCSFDGCNFNKCVIMKATKDASVTFLHSTLKETKCEAFENALSGAIVL